ncbi:prepilin-type N-terminal cleavage/methylation domain-containing protein [Alteromonas oceanisediminis]|uniref:prepilin-type N-terminal cleavage/methylation domain-containing protein n=1 Tax=Alteromonas oceanisediminis TaxID=2836180 RepID=UPI001BD98453|nr:prepilin-type N-terminal cleavage/methylation domain-containing protein [Alteromonas oceanisediminis]MBT0585046.1 prepilin-type N-terminal cleavage/methylation domain-containing protein [Alteromonas oceanisediminis]
MTAQTLTKSVANRGYTLLELLIVLLLMGLLMGLTTPRLIQMYESVSFSIERDDVLYQLGSLPFMVYQRGQAFKLLDIEKADSTDVITLPDGWRLESDETSNIIYNAFGYCSGGGALFVKNERQLRVQLEPPMCRPRILYD